MPVFMFLNLGAVAVFAWLAVLAWSDSRRREREAYYRSESLKKIAEMEGGGAASVLEYMREEDRKAARRHLAGFKLGGSVAVAAGVGLSISLLAIRPYSALYIVGVIPVLIGAAVLAYAYVLAPQE